MSAPVRSQAFRLRFSTTRSDSTHTSTTAYRRLSAARTDTVEAVARGQQGRSVLGRERRSLKVQKGPRQTTLGAPDVRLDRQPPPSEDGVSWRALTLPLAVNASIMGTVLLMGH
jgi:hypothetical protein